MVKKESQILRRIKNFIANLIIAMIITYILVGLCLLFFQKSMIYFPNDQNFESCGGFKDYEKINYNGTRFYLNKTSDNAIVYYHGNAGSACDRSFIKELFEKKNYSVIFVEYSGYSNEKIKPSKDLILNDVNNIYNYLKENLYENNIVIGQSIGSGVVSYHSTLGDVDKIILVAPFTSTLDIAKSKLPVYPVSLLFYENYDNQKWLENYKGEILIVHGSDDKMISPEFSKKLFESLRSENKEYVLIQGYGHNDIWKSNEINELISNYILE